jgi:integrase
LQPATIEGYRATLNPVLRSHGLDLSVPVVSDLFASFRTQRPRVAPVLPEWDVAFVLYCLTKAPWEPLQDISLKRLTLKTFFLLLLASGRRRSDLGALDVTRVSYTNTGSAVLYPERGFAPKTRAATEGDRAFSPITIPELASLVGRGEPDVHLCPVRALRVYLARTSAFRNGRHKLFISFQTNRRTSITTSTLSMWVKLLVRMVYQESGAGDRVLHKITPHQLRHIAISLASRVGTPLESLVRAGMWTNPNTFLSYYLSDASELLAQTGRFRLGPLVAAQVTIS